jgi:hypothetical protein
MAASKSLQILHFALLAGLFRVEKPVLSSAPRSRSNHAIDPGQSRLGPQNTGDVALGKIDPRKLVGQSISRRRSHANDHTVHQGP